MNTDTNFAQLVTDNYSTTDIERLEAMADLYQPQVIDGIKVVYKGINPDVEDYTPGVDD